MKSSPEQILEYPGGKKRLPGEGVGGLAKFGQWEFHNTSNTLDIGFRFDVKELGSRALLL